MRFEAFAFQFYGIDAEVDEQLNAAVGFDRECMVGFENLADGAVNRSNHLLPAG